MIMNGEFTMCVSEDVRTFQVLLPDMSHCLSLVSSAERSVEENDCTVFTCQDLEFELELVTQSIAKKISFIDSQGYIYYDMHPMILLTTQDEDMGYPFNQLEQEYGAITFQAFINLLVSAYSHQLFS